MKKKMLTQTTARLIATTPNTPTNVQTHSVTTSTQQLKHGNSKLKSQHTLFHISNATNRTRAAHVASSTGIVDGISGECQPPPTRDNKINK